MKKTKEDKASFSEPLFISMGCKAGHAGSEQMWDRESFGGATQPSGISEQ